MSKQVCLCTNISTSYTLGSGTPQCANLCNVILKCGDSNKKPLIIKVSFNCLWSKGVLISQQPVDSSITRILAEEQISEVPMLSYAAPLLVSDPAKCRR